MCDCIETVSAKLTAYNTRLVLPITWGGQPSVPMIRTEKVDSKKRGKEVALFATFCPFCGEKYVTG